MMQEWEPLSTQQKHAVSIVEVFRMIEEVKKPFIHFLVCFVILAVGLIDF